jgi:hypothetical protein
MLKLTFETKGLKLTLNNNDEYVESDLTLNNEEYSLIETKIQELNTDKFSYNIDIKFSHNSEINFLIRFFEKVQLTNLDGDIKLYFKLEDPHIDIDNLIILMNTISTKTSEIKTKPNFILDFKGITLIPVIQCSKFVGLTLEDRFNKFVDMGTIKTFNTLFEQLKYSELVCLELSYIKLQTREHFSLLFDNFLNSTKTLTKLKLDNLRIEDNEIFISLGPDNTINISDFATLQTVKDLHIKNSRVLISDLTAILESKFEDIYLENFTRVNNEINRFCKKSGQVVELSINSSMTSHHYFKKPLSTGSPITSKSLVLNNIQFIYDSPDSFEMKNNEINFKDYFSAIINPSQVESLKLKGCSFCVQSECDHFFGSFERLEKIIIKDILDKTSVNLNLRSNPKILKIINSHIREISINNSKTFKLEKFEYDITDLIAFWDNEELEFEDELSKINLIQMFDASELVVLKGNTARLLLDRKVKFPDNNIIIKYPELGNLDEFKSLISVFSEKAKIIIKSGSLKQGIDPKYSNICNQLNQKDIGFINIDFKIFKILKEADAKIFIKCESLKAILEIILVIFIHIFGQKCISTQSLSKYFVKCEKDQYVDLIVGGLNSEIYTKFKDSIEKKEKYWVLYLKKEFLSKDNPEAIASEELRKEIETKFK